MKQEVMLDTWGAIGETIGRRERLQGKLASLRKFNVAETVASLTFTVVAAAGLLLNKPEFVVFAGSGLVISTLAWADTSEEILNIQKTL